MSKYRRIETQFKDETTLRQALTDVCQERSILFEKGANLTLFGYRGHRRAEVADFVIRRCHIESGANDLGFARRSDGTFEAIISAFDGGEGRVGLQILNQVRQRYARLQVGKLARARGYRVEEIQGEGGGIRLRLIASSATRQPARAHVRAR